jgi:hypothetical protein
MAAKNLTSDVATVTSPAFHPKIAFPSLRRARAAAYVRRLGPIRPIQGGHP